MNPCAHPPTATITLWSVLLVSPPEPASQWIGLNPVPGMIIPCLHALACLSQDGQF